MPNGLSPHRALESGALTLELLDGLLEPRNDEEVGKDNSEAVETQTATPFSAAPW